MAYTFAGQYSNYLIGQNLTTKLLTIPTSCAVYQVGTSTPVALWTSRTKTTSLANPLPTGVTVNTPGIDTSGNVVFYTDPGYVDLLINGTSRFTVRIYMDLAETVQGPLNAASFLATAVANPTISNGTPLVLDPATGDVRRANGSIGGGNSGTSANPFDGVVWRASDSTLQQGTLVNVSGVYQLQFRTATPANPTPDIPVLTAATAGATQVTLAWALQSSAAKFQPYYNTTNNAATATAFGSPIAASSVAVTGLTNSTLYYFWLKAISFDGVTTSAFSAALSATPLPSGTPTVPIPAAPVLTAQGGATVVNLAIGAVAGAVSYTTSRLTSGGGGSSGISARDYGADGSGYSNTTSITIPSDAQVGDYCYWGCAVYNGQTFTTPTGWTLPTGAHNDDGSFSSAYVFEKKIVSGDIGATFTATASAVGQICSVFAVLPGIDGTTPRDTTLPAWGTGGTTVSTGSVTTASNTDGALVFWFQGRAGSVTPTWGSGLTGISAVGGGLYVSAGCALGTGGASGSTLGPFSVTSTGVGQAILIPLRAAAPTTGGVTGTVVHTGPELSCQDTGRTNGTSYSYQCVATNSAGVNGPASNVASATPAAVVVVTPPTGSTPLASIQMGVYRGSAYSNAPKSTGQTPGSVADYAIKARKSTTLSQMWALDFCDSTIGAQGGTEPTFLPVWAATGRRMVIGTCGIPISPDTAATTASGAYDSTWTTFAHSLVSNGMSNAILRPWCEMDLDWNYQNHQSVTDPANFVLSFRRFVNIVRAIVPTVTICWNPTSDIALSWRGTGRLEQFYPGNAYVDWLGLDPYDAWVANGASPISPYTTAQKQNLWDTITGPAMANFSAWAASKGKPIALPEWGLRLYGGNVSGGDDDIYVNNMVSFITNTANNVVFHAFWEDPSSGGEGVFDPDSGRVWKTPLARAAMNTALGSVF
jgi:hypothetical protein